LKRNLHAGKGMSGGFSINLFTDDELYEIHLATLEVMEKTGLFVEDEEALEIFDGGGARVHRESRIVKFPPYVVEDAIRSAPSKIVLAGRNPKHDFVMEGNRVGFTNFGEGILVNDLITGEQRPSTKQDTANAALLVDHLENFDVCQRAVGGRDKPPETLPVHNAEAALTHTSKHCFIGPGDRGPLKWVLELGAAVVGGKEKLRERPLLSFNTCPTSPLRLLKPFCHIVIDTARFGVTANIVSMAMAGASGPVSLAGALVIQNAEILGGIVLSQLTRKGAPVIYGSTTTIMDLKITTSPMGCPEIGMVSAAAAKLAQYYGIPSWVAGGWGDSKLPDAQAGHEKTLTALLPALAGANIIYGSGSLEMGTVLDWAQLVMDNEFAGMIKHVVKGIPVTDETLAADVIHEVGPFGDFISHDHTRKHMRTLQSQPKLIDRRRRDFWLQLGAKDLAEGAREEAKYILKTHKPDPLPPEVLSTLRSIVEAAEAELCIPKERRRRRKG
jgi:trimethylamine--corrinoid protein Co-methyltransferase